MGPALFVCIVLGVATAGLLLVFVRLQKKSELKHRIAVSSETFGGLPNALKACEALKEFERDEKVRRYNLVPEVLARKAQSLKDIATCIVSKLATLDGLAIDERSLRILETIPAALSVDEQITFSLNFLNALQHNLKPSDFAYQRMVDEYVEGYGDKTNADAYAARAVRTLKVLRLLVKKDLFPETNLLDPAAA